MNDSDTQEIERLFAGRYRIIRRLGQGGMARVFLAEDLTLHRQVAVKVLSDRYADDPQFVERFRREARAAAGLNHPNIVQIYDTGEAHGHYYIVMEHLEGESLKELIRREAPLSDRRAIDLSLQILSALRFAHQGGVVHRDVKPQNIMVLRDGRLKVMDFGIARHGASDMTEPGSIIGTAQYLSPEQARGQHVGPPSDLYSAGIVLYEMLTGQVPFEGDSAVAVAMKQVQKEPALPSTLNPALEPALEAVVMKSLAKDPARRYANADEMGIDLDRVRKGMTPAAGSTAQATMIVPPPRGGTPPGGAVEQERKRWPWILVALLVLLLLGLGVAAWAALGGGGGSTTTTGATMVNVPNVTGLSVDQARTVVEGRGFQVKIVTKASTAQPKGTVLKQDPLADTAAPSGSTVVLTVSAGPTKVKIPDVSGKSPQEATATLTQAGFSVTTQDTPSDTVAKGTVIGTTPAAGTSVAKGSAVVILVSSGAAPVQVPTVVGKTEADARAALVSAGFNPIVAYQDSSTVANGVVISQSPTGTAAAGSNVSILVAKTPAPPPGQERVPDVVGQTAADAKAAVEALGLVWAQTTVGPGPDCAAPNNGYVLSTDPPKHTKVDAGSTVTGTVCKAS